LIFLLLTACSTPFVKPAGEREAIFPYTAFGTFTLKSSKGTHRGMWEIRATSSSSYRLSLYSAVGTLIGCTQVAGEIHSPCKKGMKDLGNTKEWDTLPKELLLKLPSILSGDIGRKGEGEETTIVSRNGEVMRIEMLQQEDQPFPHPLFINVKMSRTDCPKCNLALRIQVEEISQAQR
jgi:hypothetical protein